MTIRPSQRQQTRQPEPKTPFQLHHVMAKRRYWQLRLLICSALACLVSIIAWLLDVPLIWHALSTSVAFAAGFVYPLKNLQSRALEWIAREGGLSYGTALEWQEREDTFGLKPLLLDRALQQEAKLEPPAVQAWWLPLLALAAGFMLLPALTLFGFDALRSPLAPALQQRPAQVIERVPENVNPLQTQEPQNEGEQATQQAASEEAQSDSGGGDSGNDFDTPGTDPADDSNAQAGDQEVLSRFAENLREREPGDPQNQQSQQQPEQSGEPNAQQDGTPQEGGEGTPQDPQQSNAGENGEEGEQGEQNASSGDQEGQQQNEGEQSSEQASGDGEGEPQESADNNDGNAGDNEQLQASGQSSEQGADEELSEGANDTAGNNSSNETPSEGLNEDGGQLELLRGELEDGPLNSLGTLRLPGKEGEEARQVQAADSEAYQRALERAINEGNIPVEYQEVVRNYFR